MEEFLRDKNILLVESSELYKRLILDVLKELGVDYNNIQTCSKFEKAEWLLKEKEYLIIISEFDLEANSGLDLKNRVDKLDYAADPVFILISNRASNISVMEAAEESVDAYILKPISKSKLIESIRETFEQVQNPTPYMEALQRCRGLIKKQCWDDAKHMAEKSLEHHKSPAMSYYYLGFISENIGDLKAAAEYYAEGLKQVPFHYKCMVGEFEVLDRQNRKEEAYKIVQQLMTVYPLSPQRFEKVIMLAIFTKHFNDVSGYYNLYKAEDNVTPALRKIMSQAMFISGKFFFLQKNYEKAIDFLEKSAEVSLRSSEILIKIVKLYLENDMHESADTFFQFFKEEDRESQEYGHLDFYISNYSNRSQDVIKKGKALIDKNTPDSKVYKIVIDKLMETRKAMVAEEVVYKAIQKFPEMKTEFLKKIESETN